MENENIEVIPFEDSETYRYDSFEVTRMRR